MENEGKRAVAESSSVGHVPSDSSSTTSSVSLSPIRDLKANHSSPSTRSPAGKRPVSDSPVAHIPTDSTSSSPSHGLSPDRNGKPISPSPRSPAQSSICSELSDHSSLSRVPSLHDDLTQLSPLESEPGEPITPPPQPRPVVNRSIWEEPKPVRKADPSPIDGFVDGASGAGGGGGGGEGVSVGGGRRARQSLSILRRAKRETNVKKVALGFRVFGLIFCLISFAVMAADKSKGWAMDSFYRYKEFRYCITVNVISFVYLAAQACDLIYQLSTNKHSVRNQVRHYFDFSMDQILTYLLMSASSSAATRVDDWQSNWGKDEFPQMATGSVATSFLAFVALACSAVISGYTLFTSRFV